MTSYEAPGRHYYYNYYYYYCYYYNYNYKKHVKTGAGKIMIS